MLLKCNVEMPMPAQECDFHGYDADQIARQHDTPAEREPLDPFRQDPGLAWHSAEYR
jgi:hypothetical protein